MVCSEMRVLLLSMILYLIGIALLLFFRPSLMFHKDGRWKEFGIGNDETTIFPVWMFCIAWAVLSYGICRLIFKEPHTHTLLSVAANDISENLVQPLSGPAEASKPGYYKLDASVLRKKGVPRYIYVGPETPGDLEESSS